MPSCIYVWLCSCCLRALVFFSCCVRVLVLMLHAYAHDSVNIVYVYFSISLLVSPLCHKSVAQNCGTKLWHKIVAQAREH